MGTYAQVHEFRALRLLVVLLTAALLVSGLRPGSARADGPITPVATDYLARVTHSPTGVQAKVVDGYINLWMQAPAGHTVVVLDYRGAPWVRFDGSGVSINTNSQEYYLNQVPVPAVPPPGLTPSTPPHWVPVSHGHAYMWREGRLHALATVAPPEGNSYVGSWRIALAVDGRPAYIAGGIWHRGSPSIVWFWPILVLLACVAAAWRVRSPELDRRLRTGIELTLLVATAIGLGAHYLHGRPTVTVIGVALTALVIAICAAAFGRVLSGRSGTPLAVAIAIIALWAGLTLLPVLTHGYVLMAIPAFLARTIAALLLGGSLSLALLITRVPVTAGLAARA